MGRDSKNHTPTLDIEPKKRAKKRRKFGISWLVYITQTLGLRDLSG